MGATTPIAKKLRIAPADRFALVHAPPGYAAKVGLTHREGSLSVTFRWDARRS
jgi:hypothetical protein